MRIINTADLTPTTPLTQNENDWIYNGLDCAVTLEVLGVIESQLDNVSRNTYEFSKALQGPVLDMTTRGVLVDQSRRAKVLSDTRAEIARLERQLDRLLKEGVGLKESINWRSWHQLQNLFYDILSLPPVKKRNANGVLAPTINREAIERLSIYLPAEPICNHVLTLRDLDKKRQFLETEIDRDGRMRGNFNIAGTNTGRLASSVSDLGTGTNMQNIDRELRSVFIADPGMKFANLDLEQGDARNVGAICWNTFAVVDENFAGSYLAACESGDLHTTVARLVWPLLAWSDPRDPVEDKRVADALAYRQDSYRQLAKKLGHGTNYFGTPPTMARHAKVERSLIEDFQKGYFQRFPVIGCYDKSDKTTDCWHNRIRQALIKDQQLTTLLGRRRFFFGRPYDDETLRGAIAYEPQSLTADEIDTGMLRIWRANLCQLLLQVHDSLLVQYPEELENEVLPKLLTMMKVVIPLAKGRDFYVPVEAKVGWNWGDYSDKNPNGLKKWQGNDQRRRQHQTVQRLSVFDLVDDSKIGSTALAS